MKQMIALWSMVKVHELMVAGSSLCPIYAIDAGRKTNEAREHFAWDALSNTYAAL